MLTGSNSIQELVRFPVRGSNCKHADVFDYKFFLELLNDLKQNKETELVCPICSILCPSFKYDSLIYRCIQGFPEYEEKQPEGIQIERNGEFAWVLDNSSDEVAENGKVNGVHARGEGDMEEESKSVESN